MTPKLEPLTSQEIEKLERLEAALQGLHEGANSPGATPSVDKERPPDVSK